MPTGGPDPYLSPSGEVLANRLGITDGRELAIAQSVIVAAAIDELLRAEVVLDGPVDEGYLRRVHRHCYGDMFDWAGEYRVTDEPASSVPPGLIRADVADTLRVALTEDWAELDAAEVAMVAAEAWAGLAGAVPFREGSMVAAAVVVDEIAQRAGWQIDWTASPAVAQRIAVETAHHAVDLAALAPAVEVIEAGLARRPGGPKLVGHPPPAAVVVPAAPLALEQPAVDVGGPGLAV